MPLARQIREAPQGLALQADVKKPETGSGFWNWWPVAESNHGHADFQSAALPTELTGRREVRIKPYLDGAVNTF